MPLDQNEALMVDHQKARDHIDKYKDAITRAFIARVAILNGAIQDFNTFRDLPPESNIGSAIWDVSFGILSTLVPALRLGDFLQKQYERAEVALKAAEAFGQTARRADKVIKVVTGNVQTGGTAAKYANQVKGILEKAEKLSPDVKKATRHVARKPILELIDDLSLAPQVWEKAIEAETRDWQNRLADLPATGTLLGKVSEILKLPEEFSPSDVDEIWNAYLYLMVLEHCKREVYWQHTIISYGYGQYGNEYELKGINGNQRKLIIEWFGPGTRRGKYFRQPIFFDFTWFLAQWPVREEVKHRNMTFDIRAKV